MSDPRAYRNKMSLVVDRSGDAAGAGLLPAALARRRADRRAVPIVTPTLNADLRRLERDCAGPSPVAAMLRDARHIVARSARRSAAERPDDHDGAAVAKRRARGAGSCCARSRTSPASRTRSILRARTRSWAGVTACSRGDGEIEETIGGVRYRVSPASFFQVNVEIVGRIFAATRAVAARDPHASSISTAASARSRSFSQARLQRLRRRGERTARSPKRAANAALNGLERLTSLHGRARRAAGRAHRRCASELRETRRRSFSIRRARAATRATLERDRAGARSGGLVSLVRPSNAGTGFEVPGGQGIPARRRAAVRHVSADRARRDARSTGVFVNLPSDTIDIRYVAKLARIALTDEEVETLRAAARRSARPRQRACRARYESVPATAQVVESRNVTRDDELRPCLDRERVLAEAPQRQGGFFRVPRIIAE